MSNPTLPISAIDVPTAQRAAPGDKKLQASAQQFESLLITQMLRSMRESGSGWLGTGEDTTSAPAIEMAEEQFAQAMASQGALGLAAMVQANLNAAAKSK